MKKYTKKKKDGATFTPQGLANFLAEKLYGYLTVDQKNKQLIINDPSCGDGALLFAMASILTKYNNKFVITGTDTNEEYIQSSQQLLSSSFPSVDIQLNVKDFVATRVTDIFSNEASRTDLIIANPPYVRTQIIGAEAARRISKLYELTGRIDLYYPFLINMTEKLKEGGLLGVITSNRYLSTKSGMTIRDYLIKNYEILEIIDLGDTKLFDAAVLPAIFIGRRKTCSTYHPAKYTTIYESFEGSGKRLNNIFEILNNSQNGLYSVNDRVFNLTLGTLKEPESHGGIWQIESNTNKDFVSTIKKKKYKYVGDIFKVRVGIKSCADDVFFTKNWDKGKPEDVFFKPMISQENICKWQVVEPLTKVIYPHFDNNGVKDVYDINKYPKACSFFEAYRARLEERSYLIKAKRNWYEYWVPQNPTLWSKPKLVWADISVESRFALDKTGAIVNGNCYWICADNNEEEELLYLIMGVANTSMMERYHDACFNNKLYSGRRRYLSQYIEQYPIPDPTIYESKEIIKKVKELLSEDNNAKRSKIADQIEQLVHLAFGVRD